MIGAVPQYNNRRMVIGQGSRNVVAIPGSCVSPLGPLAWYFTLEWPNKRHCGAAANPSRRHGSEMATKIGIPEYEDEVLAQLSEPTSRCARKYVTGAPFVQM